LSLFSCLGVLPLLGIRSLGELKTFGAKIVAKATRPRSCTKANLCVLQVAHCYLSSLVPCCLCIGYSFCPLMVDMVKNAVHNGANVSFHEVQCCSIYLLKSCMEGPHRGGCNGLLLFACCSSLKLWVVKQNSVQWRPPSFADCLFVAFNTSKGLVPSPIDECHDVVFLAG
jgi:hypothetical protein